MFGTASVTPRSSLVSVHAVDSGSLAIRHGLWSRTRRLETSESGMLRSIRPNCCDRIRTEWFDCPNIVNLGLTGSTHLD
jgi:hypothetical protein